MKNIRNDNTAPVSKAEFSIFDAGAFLYSPQMSNDAGIRHNHRALLWYSGAWGRSLPTSIMQIPADLHCLPLLSRIRNDYHQSPIFMSITRLKIARIRSKKNEFQHSFFCFRTYLSDSFNPHRFLFSQLVQIGLFNSYIWHALLSRNRW